MIITDRCEVNLTRHCNNSCACCNHASPLAEHYFMEPDTLRRDLDILSKIIHTGFFCLQGGEPLLNPKVIEFLDVQKQSGFADQYGMLSNGRLLSRMPEEFFQKCGSMTINGKKFELRVSVYANFNMRELDPSIAKAVKYGFEIRPGPTPTFWKLFQEQSDGGLHNWQVCYARGCHTVHEGYFYHCPLAAFFPKQFHGWDEHVDGISLDGITEEKLRDFLDRPEPLKTCGKCTGGNIGMPWHETWDRETWMKEATA